MFFSPVPPRYLLAALLLILEPSVVVFAQTAGKEFTPEQKEKLKDIARWTKESAKHDAEGKLDLAIGAAENVLRIERSLNDETHEDVVAALQRLAGLHERQGDFTHADKLRREVLASQQKRFARDHWQVLDARLALDHVSFLKGLPIAIRERLDTARLLLFQGKELDAQGKYRDAVARAEKALGIRLEFLGEDHPHTAAAMYSLGDWLDDLGNEPPARANLEKALAVRKRVLGDHPDTAYSLNLLGIVATRQRDYAGARAYYEQALTLRRKVLGEYHGETAKSLSNLAILLNYQGEYAKARLYYEQCLAIRKKLLGDKHVETAKVLTALGDVLYQLADYPAARRHYEQALAIFREVLGENHTYTANVLSSLGSLQERQGDIPAARSYFEKGLAINKKQLGDENAAVAWSLTALGGLLESQGDYTGARLYYEQALAIYKKTLGDDHPSTANSLRNLGDVLARQGDYAGARRNYEHALAIQKKKYGDNHVATTATLHSLGWLLDNHGDIEGARAYYEQALAIRLKVLGENHPDTAWCMNNLGWLLYKQKDVAGALKYHEKTLAIRKKILGDSHPDTAYSLLNLGLVHQRQGDYAAARSFQEQALAVRLKAWGETHSEVAWSLHNLGTIASSQKDYAGARAYHDRALAIRRKLLGENHPETANSWQKLGEISARLGNVAEARDFFIKALTISRRNVELAALAQSEREQLLMSASLRFPFYGLLNLTDNTEAANLTAYAQALAWKGLVLDRQMHLRLERQDPKLMPLVADLRDTSRQLAHLAFAVPDAKKREAWTKRLQELSEQKEKLERDLAEKSQSFRQDQELKNLTPARLLEVLPADTALVDYLVYRHRQPNADKKGHGAGKEHLTAFVLKPGSAVVRFDLGPMEPIEKSINEWRNLTKKQPGKDHPGTELRRLLWQPLEKHLAGAKTVIVAPDGALGRFPFAALPGSKTGSYLLEEVALTVVPVPRLLPELLGPSKAAGTAVEPSLLLVGDVDFDAVPGKITGGGRPVPASERSGPGKKWRALPGTRGEILTIRDSFEQRFADSKVKTLRGDQATEKALRELGPKYSILHLATHGFFAAPEVPSALASEEKDRQRGDQAGKAFGKDGITGYHPGLLSGLVLAGANRPPDAEQADGILTALEVAELDLRKVDLAVLSACETGLGKVAAGEGILGLQRAFQVGGARSVVASLWSIDDKATRSLMERFYENLWQKKLTKQEALRQAQLAMLRGELERGAVREDDEPANRRLPPYYWAAFVLSGDWR